MNSKSLFLSALGYLLFSYVEPALAQRSATSECEALADEPLLLHRYPGIVNVYIENDLFANRDADYTSGVKFSWVSPNLQDFEQDRCMPPWLRAANRVLTRLHPGPKDAQYHQRNVVFTLGQSMFTPVDKDRTDLIKDDRPYAGYAYAGFAYNARNDWQMETVEIQLGMIGPGSGARRAQDFIHKIRGLDLFQGWDNQIPNELGFLATYERKHKWEVHSHSTGFGADFITHGGLSLGNVRTSLNAGAEARIGWHIPNDFGTSPIRPAGDNNAPLPGQTPFDANRLGVHLFASVDARAVARDFSIDGTLFSDSHSVKRRPFVADLSAGLALRYQGWKVGFSRVFRTREFVGQAQTPRYGSFTISREY
jgi:lipid A 3-O-deacylase